ncbi:MAG: succinylglutamate desuccinylase/aspartoacylase family protein [Bdellovibrionales bacterium]|nr:succinylglutamate desuccinylase/aspartoacylase family protein [Bdellovibrionales bacterium]
MTDSLQILKHIPEGFLNIKPRDIIKLISSPTIFHLKGKEEPPLFISLLLHGNEFSGLIILQEILKKYEKDLPRNLIIFIGNPKACAQGVRHLEDQPDFNRIWNKEHSSEYPLTGSVLEYVKKNKIYAAVDIHNNTGENPLYACISKKDLDFIKLAQSFSENIVYFTRPHSVLSQALSLIAPSLVIECGLPGYSQGITTGVQFIEKLLNSQESWKKEEIQIPYVYSTYATLLIDSDSEISFESQLVLKKGQLCLSDQIDQLNLKEVPVGTILGKVNNFNPFKLIDNKGQDVFNQFFSIINNNWIVKASFIPSMFTKDTRIAKSDCLGYVMQKISITDFLNKQKNEANPV